MPVREFANQKALIEYAERNGLVYLWETMPVSKGQGLLSTLTAFTKRQQMLSPDQYEIVDVRTSYRVRRAMLFPKAILQAEFDAEMMRFYSASPSALGCCCCCCWTTGCAALGGGLAASTGGSGSSVANRSHTRAISIRSERASLVSTRTATAKHSAARRRYSSRLPTSRPPHLSMSGRNVSCTKRFPGLSDGMLQDTAGGFTPALWR
jgi:hypothetical protein